MDDWLLYVHLLFLATAIVGIVLADHSGFAWMRGKVETVSKASLLTAHYIVTTGLLGLIYTGLFLFWPLRDFLLHQPFFLFKLLFVGILILNALVIDWLMYVASMRPYASLTSNQKAPLLISGAVSGVGWVSIVALAWLQFGWPFY